MSERVVLDAKGLKCPLPVLRARKAIKALRPGDVLVVLATDPGAGPDFESFCRVTGHRLLDVRDDAGALVIEIEKAA
ncbi:MAG: sulfurtransferase TusA family protein [Alphaproteobacteria bacterium]